MSARRTAAAGRGASGPGGDPERAFEFGGRLGMADLRRVGLRNDEDVERGIQILTPRSEDLPHQPLDSVAYDRVTHARAHRDPEPGRAARRGRLQDHEARCVAPPAETLEGQKLPPPP